VKGITVNQTPAAILVLAASVFSYVAHAASMSSHSQASVMLTLVAIAVGLWGMVSLFSASVREREKLVDSQSRLESLDQIMELEPLKSLKQVGERMIRRDPPAPPAVVPPEPVAPPQSLGLPAELEAQLSVVAQKSGRDRSELLAEALRNNLSQGSSNRVA
tara:strand:+ start:159 stop:641 length:483 start_codon:yes stop_codon:yes gene_type:complete